MATKSSFIYESFFFTFFFAYGSSLENVNLLENIYRGPEFSETSLELSCDRNPWYDIAAARELQLFDAKDWLYHETLIPLLPVDLSHKVNLTNSTILILGKQKLPETLLQKFAEAVERENPHVLQDVGAVRVLGNIFCGFSQFHMSCITDDVLQSLWKVDFFRSIRGCKQEKLKVLLKKLEGRGIIGPSSAWDPETIKRLGVLVSALPPEGFKKIRLRSMSSISPEVIKATPPDTLKEMFTDQLRRLSRESLLQWRRTTKDSRPLYAKSTQLPPNIKLLTICSIITKVFFNV